MQTVQDMLRAALAIALVAGLSVPAANAATTWDGVFTADQAARGGALYEQKCVLCHGQDMAGTMSAPPLADIGFLYVWDGMTLADLFEFTKTMMPPTEVGSLRDEQVADLIAATLLANSYPAGSAELPGDPAALAAIAIQREQ